MSRTPRATSFRYKFEYLLSRVGPLVQLWHCYAARGRSVRELPEVFRSIPQDHAKAHVLAAVPHTDEARMAILEASIPRKSDGRSRRRGQGCLGLL